MRSLFSLAWRSVLSRKTAAFLTILSIAISTSLFLGVEKVQRSAEAGFNATISGTDLIVGARTGAVNLLLYAVFHIGEPTANVSWESYSRYKDNPDVTWTIPLALGDSHENYKVLGTDQNFFDHFQYGGDRHISIASGRRFEAPHDAVIGSEVAKKLDYSVGDHIILTHGLVSADFAEHKDDPFTIVGILAPTGTPVDRTIHVPLAGIDAMHEHFFGGQRASGTNQAGQPHTQLTAFLVGMENRALALRLQRDINTDREEPLLAILPGVALAQLWGIVGSAQAAFRVTALVVVVAGLLGLMAMILTTLNERRREIAVLRAAGAGAGSIFSLLILEATVFALLGTALGAGLVFGALTLFRPIIEGRYGIPLGELGPSPYDGAIAALIVALATLMGCFPAWNAYRQSLASGLTPRL